MKIIRRTMFLALLSLAATACGTSSILGPDCTDPAVCHNPDSGSHNPDSGSHNPDSGSHNPDSGS
ncbi:MAG: hypothetical protein ACE5GJ_01290 [Gemmatimonadota bacterium]